MYEWLHAFKHWHIKFCSPILLCLILPFGYAMQVVYKRYASLYFVMGIDGTDNELITLEVIHEFVEVLDRYFGNVCELDLIFNFHKVRMCMCICDIIQSNKIDVWTLMLWTRRPTSCLMKWFWQGNSRSQARRCV